MNAKGQYQMRPVPVSAKRCEHGFLGGVECQECNPEIMCCALCGNVGHESKLCPETVIGRSRRAQLREAKKRERKRQARRKRKVLESDIACQTQDPARVRGEP